MTTSLQLLLFEDTSSNNYEIDITVFEDIAIIKNIQNSC